MLEGFTGPFEKVTDWNVPVPRRDRGLGTCERVQNDCFLALNRLLKTRRGFATVRACARARIGLWDQYGGSMESGWTRWILEQFEFPFTRVFAPELDAGNLNAKYDVLILPSGAIPAVPARRRRGWRWRRAADAAAAPADRIRSRFPRSIASQLGRVTADRTIPQIPGVRRERRHGRRASATPR